MAAAKLSSSSTTSPSHKRLREEDKPPPSPTPEYSQPPAKKIESDPPEPPPSANATQLSAGSQTDAVHLAENGEEESRPAPGSSDAQPAPTDEIIDFQTFDQILELDEDTTFEFSKGMVWAYFSQASTTFQEMTDAYEDKNLGKLSSLGHFLKGSSAALGVTRVQELCEQIQHYGQLRDEDENRDLQPAQALDKIKTSIARARKEYTAAEKWLRRWFEDHGAGGDPDPE